MAIGFPTTYQTESIAYGEGNIASATLNIDTACLSDTGGFVFYLTNDGGTTWEQVTNQVENTFSSTGGDLRLQILGNPGEQINIKTASGKIVPIKVSYNYA